MLAEGSAFPLFQLPDQDGAIVSIQDLAGQVFLAYFYPKDDTTGCTAEACGFRDSFPRFQGVRVIGISPDSPKSHRKFADKYDLPFTLLADESHSLADACGVWVEKSLYGRKYMGVQRASFLVGGDGVVLKAWPNVKPAGHADEVLSAVKELQPATG
jgi:peroxiredoxin Q/BCP